LIKQPKNNDKILFQNTLKNYTFKKRNFLDLKITSVYKFQKIFD